MARVLLAFATLLLLPAALAAQSSSPLFESGPVRPLALTPDGMELAHEIYAKARPGYHALTVSIVDQIVKWDEGT